MNAFTWLRRSPRLAVVIAVVGIAAVAAAVAFAATGPAIQTSTPHFAGQITNIDVLRQQIKNYYGDPLAVTGPNGTWSSGLNLDSNYAREAGSVADEGGHWLAARAHAHYKSGMKAIVLDVDDTTLATWNYEVYSNWDYNPTTNATFVTGMLFPAVPGMVDMVPAGEGRGLHDHLDHGPARRPGGGDAREPDQDRRRLPGADRAAHGDAGRRCGRPLHEARRP